MKTQPIKLQGKTVVHSDAAKEDSAYSIKHVTVRCTRMRIDISSDAEFTRKYGKRVRGMGGSYTECRSGISYRCVYIPYPALKDPKNRQLVDEFVDEFSLPVTHFIVSFSSDVCRGEDFKGKTPGVGPFRCWDIFNTVLLELLKDGKYTLMADRDLRAMQSRHDMRQLQRQLREFVDLTKTLQQRVDIIEDARGFSGDEAANIRTLLENLRHWADPARDRVCGVADDQVD